MVGSGGRSLVERVSDALKVCRELRYSDPESFDDVTDDELVAVARWLKAVAYSCQVGARLLERVLAARRGDGHPVPAPGHRPDAGDPL